MIYKKHTSDFCKIDWCISDVTPAEQSKGTQLERDILKSKLAAKYNTKKIQNSKGKKCQKKYSDMTPAEQSEVTQLMRKILDNIKIQKGKNYQKQIQRYDACGTEQSDTAGACTPSRHSVH